MVDKQGMAYGTEDHAIMVLKSCQLIQGAVLYPWQKAMGPLSYVPTTTDASAQTEL